MIRELSEVDVKGMLLSFAWRNVRDEWRKEMHEKVVNDDADNGV